MIRFSCGVVIALGVLGLYSTALAQEKSDPPSAAGSEKQESPPDLDNFVCLRGFDPRAKRERFSACATFYTELYRQAFLLAARDEFQLSTRDEQLGDRAYDPNIKWFAVEIHSGEGDKLAVDVVQGQGARSRRTLGSFATPPYSREQVDWPATVEFVERASREQLAELLHQAKFSKKPNPRREQGPIPPEIEAKLKPLSLAGHLSALRDLHELMREPGESPEVLGALVRTYANLGVLTEHFWQPLHKSYRARAMLYAQRLVQQKPDAAWGLWHRAYAAALVGLPLLADADLKAAAKLAQPDQPAPPWLELIDAYCHCDLDRLNACCEADKNDTLAPLLTLLVINQPSASAVTIEYGLAASERAPNCLRILEILNHAGGVALRHQTTTAPFSALIGGVAGEILAIRGAPIASLKLARDIGRRQNATPVTEESIVSLAEYAQLISSLRTKEAAYADRGEPSFAAFEHLLVEGAFASAWRRAQFLRGALATEADDFIDEIQPLVAEHPFRGLLNLFRANEQTRFVEAMGIFRQPAFALSERSREELLRYPFPRQVAEAIHPVFENDWQKIDPGLFCDARAATQRDRGWKTAWRFHEAHPWSPEPIISLISSPGGDAQDKREEFRREFGRHPGVLAALAHSYVNDKNLAAAEPCLKELLKQSKDWWVYKQLADIQKERGDVDGWKSTLEQSLAQPDYGLYHAQARVQLAKHYLAEGNVKKAIPYAELAAQTGAAWAMMCASEVHEVAGNLDQSEAWIASCSQRYQNQAFLWLSWCLRNGQGDVPAALAIAEPFIAAGGNRRSPLELRLIGASYLVTGQPRKAIPLFEAAEVREYSTPWGLHLAVVAELAEDTAVRDAALKKVREKATEKDPDDPSRVALATWLQSVYAGEGLKDAKLDDAPELVRDIQSGKAPDLQYQLGQLLLAAGRQAEGTALLKAAAKQEGGLLSSRLARFRLAELGIQVPLAPRPTPKPKNEKENQPAAPSGERSPMPPADKPD